MHAIPWRIFVPLIVNSINGRCWVLVTIVSTSAAGDCRSCRRRSMTAHFVKRDEGSWTSGKTAVLLCNLEFHLHHPHKRPQDGWICQLSFGWLDKPVDAFTVLICADRAVT